MSSLTFKRFPSFPLLKWKSNRKNSLTVQGKQWKNSTIKNTVKHTRKTQNRQKSIFTCHSADGKRLAYCWLWRMLFKQETCEVCALWGTITFQLRRQTGQIYSGGVHTAAIVQELTHNSHICRTVKTFFVGASHYLTGSKWWKRSYSTKSSVWDPINHLQCWQQ